MTAAQHRYARTCGAPTPDERPTVDAEALLLAAFVAGRTDGVTAGVWRGVVIGAACTLAGLLLGAALMTWWWMP